MKNTFKLIALISVFSLPETKACEFQSDEAVKDDLIILRNAKKIEDNLLSSARNYHEDVLKIEHQAEEQKHKLM